MPGIHKKSSFTLLEMMTVMIILTVIGGLALPRYNSVVERSRSAEGVQILTTLLAAQHRFALENGGQFRTGSAGGNRLNTTDLDVNFQTASGSSFLTRFFEIQIYGGVVVSPNPVARVFRKNCLACGEMYRLEIDPSGVMSCTDIAPFTYCRKFFDCGSSFPCS